MIRTQVYLPKILYQQVALIAKREKKAKAQVIRESLERSLRETKTEMESFKKYLTTYPLPKPKLTYAFYNTW